MIRYPRGPAASSSAGGPASEGLLFARTLLREPAPRAPEERVLGIDREDLEWLAIFSPKWGRKLREATRPPCRDTHEREQLEWLAEISIEHKRQLGELLRREAAEAAARVRAAQILEGLKRVAEEEWDPAKHPRLGGPPNAGWFAATGGALAAVTPDAQAKQPQPDRVGAAPRKAADPALADLDRKMGEAQARLKDLQNQRATAEKNNDREAVKKIQGQIDRTIHDANGLRLKRGRLQGQSTTGRRPAAAGSPNVIPKRSTPEEKERQVLAAVERKLHFDPSVNPEAKQRVLDTLKTMYRMGEGTAARALVVAITDSKRRSTLS